MSNQKFILIFLAVSIIISFSFLAFSERKQHDIKDGWFLYFNNIKDSSTDFTIENYSSNSNFSWELIVNEETISKKNIQVLKGNKENVKINSPLNGTQIKIKVYHAKEIKEIYKNFAQ
ncbi:MAG: hypothetical protein UR60_C0030G0002 [Candidatus Moranbacteria bacterium GW2011_GWF2_34_56]|nr:MAG: hypothetical protein UR51_C0005G0063 [Candidatus Moranbacteria bacterium GW2011_GWF1_34_10]KKP64047.1 MAG: hypothetical protein UR60_C0030G0002 [Candidatus Moranbacteria bacterium GW2011_GWF2_34_56]HBI17229.1 hypothetical protein [Candidatus Moranbacteria bacterium]